MGYQAHIDAGWSAAQCYAHAGRPKRKPAPRKVDVEDYKRVIIAKREELDAADYEITRLRDLVLDLGGDPDAI